MRRQPGLMQNALMGVSLLLIVAGWPTVLLVLSKDRYEPKVELPIGMLLAVGVAILVWLFPYRRESGDLSKTGQYLSNYGVGCGIYCGFSLVSLLIFLLRALLWQPWDVSEPVHVWVRPAAGLVLTGLCAMGAFALWFCSRDDLPKRSADAPE